jgi:prepilin-type N-terminal cleavage/methylation domain-containing protein
MKTAQFLKSKKGFTLIELLVVIGILAILLSIVLIAINPARQFGQANNTRRHSDITAILNAVGAYSADKKGVLPTQIPVYDVAKANNGALPVCKNTATPANCADLCADLVTDYIPALPMDPQTGTGTSVTDCTVDYTTGYTVLKDGAGRVTVSAPGAENGETISNTR